MDTNYHITTLGVHLNDMLAKQGRKITILLNPSDLPFLPTDARIKFCQAFVFPHLDYRSCIRGSAQLGRLFKLQKRAARMIYDLSTRTPTKPLLKKLGWMPLTDRVQNRKSLMGYKSPKGLAPQYMAETYKFVHDVSGRVT